MPCGLMDKFTFVLSRSVLSITICTIGKTYFKMAPSPNWQNNISPDSIYTVCESNQKWKTCKHMSVIPHV